MHFKAGCEDDGISDLCSPSIVNMHNVQVAEAACLHRGPLCVERHMQGPGKQERVESAHKHSRYWAEGATVR